LPSYGMHKLMAWEPMQTYQIQPTAIHYTRENLSCNICSQKSAQVLEIKEKSLHIFVCFLKSYCLQTGLTVGWYEMDYESLNCRLIEDVDFHKKATNKKQERGKATLKLRYEILKRDGFKCTSCGSQDQLEVDHIIPISNGGKTVEGNLQTLCFKCNRGKGKN